MFGALQSEFLRSQNKLEELRRRRMGGSPQELPNEDERLRIREEIENKKRKKLQEQAKELKLDSPLRAISVDAIEKISCGMFHTHGEKVMLFVGTSLGELHVWVCGPSFTKVCERGEIRKFWALSAIAVAKDSVRFSSAVDQNHIKQLKKVSFENLVVETDEEAQRCTFMSNSDFSYLIFGTGGDLYFVSVHEFTTFYHIEDAFETTIQTIKVLSSNYIAVSALESKIKLWNTSTLDLTFTLDYHEDAVLCFSYLPLSDGSWFLASGADDTTIRVWKGPSDCPNTPLVVSKAIKCISEHDEFIIDVHFHKKLLISAGGDFKIYVFNEEFEKIHLLSDSLYVIKISIVSNKMLVGAQIIEDSEETTPQISYLTMFDISNVEPTKWQHIAKDKQRARTFKIDDMLCAYSIEKELIVATFAENSCDLNFWQTPMFWRSQCKNKIRKEISNDIPSKIAGIQKKPRIEATSATNNFKLTKISPSPTQKIQAGPAMVTSGEGDTIAKAFIRNILQIKDLSPDMKRLLNVCLTLHQP